MKELDPGHVFELTSLAPRPCEGGAHGDPSRCAEHGGLYIEADGHCRRQLSRPSTQLVFVKRQGPKFPGNVGEHPGTTTQEVLRALIARTIYVDQQEPSEVNRHVLKQLRTSIVLLEQRAAMRACRGLSEAFLNSPEPELFATCSTCGHVECTGH